MKNLLKFITVFILFSSFGLISCTNGGGGGGTKSNPPPPAPNPKPTPTPDPNQNKSFEENVNSNDCFGLSPFESDLQVLLGDQIRSGDASCTKKVIEMGANVNKPIKQFGSRTEVLPVFYAMENSSLFFVKSKFKEFSILKVLIQAGADLSVKNEDGLTPLMLSLKSEEIATDYPLVPGYLIYSGKPDLNEVDSKGMTPLMICIDNQYENLAIQLIYKDAKFDLKSKNNESAIQMAMREKMESVIDLLISKNADITVLDKNKNNLLHLAIRYDLNTIALKLVKMIPDINGQNSDKETALYLSVEKNSIDIVKALLENKANPDLGSNESTPLHLSLRKQYHQISGLLIENIKNPNAKDDQGIPLVYVALKYSNYEVTKKLISQNAELNFKDDDGDSLLHLAVENAAHEIINLLLDKNIAIDIENSKSETPIFYAIRNDDINSFNLLIKKGANIDKFVKGSSYLIYALEMKVHPDIINYLIQYTKNINAINSNGTSALLIAIKNANSEQAIQLLNRGADPNVQDNNFNSPVSLAVAKNNVELMNLLIAKGAKLNYLSKSGQNLAHIADSTQMLEILQKSGVSIDEKDSAGETPLSKAVANGRLDLVTFLSSHGANTKWLSKEKRTLIHIAVYNGQAGVLAYLINIPLDVNAKDQNGEIALFDAYSVNIMDQLIRAGSDINSTNKKGLSVLASFVEDFNPRFGSLELIEKLLQMKANPNVKSSTGEFLLHYIVNFEPFDGDPRNKNKNLSSSYDASSLIRLFLDSPSIDTEIKDANDETALHKVDTPEETELLINAGVNLNPINKNKKQTPLLKKQFELSIMESNKTKLNTEIQENKKLLDEAIRNGDRTTEYRLENLIHEQELELIVLNGDIISMKSLIKILIDRGAH